MSLEQKNQNREVEESLESRKDVKEEELDSSETSNKEVEVADDNLLATKDADLHSQLIDKLTQAKITAGMKHEEYLKVHKDLEESSANFMRLENHIIKTTVATSLSLLKELDVANLEENFNEVQEIEQENSAELLKINPISKGSLKALFFGAIGALATVAGIGTYGAKIAGLPLNSATFMQTTNLQTIATKLAELIQIKDTPLAGYLLTGAIALLVGAIIYNLVKFLQKRKNIKYINRLEGDVEKYIQELDEKIEKSNLFKEHLDNIKLVMQKYDIILQEQNAKIRRMQFIEQPVDGVHSLQRASQVEVEKTILLLDELLKLMNTPVNEGLEITKESHENLHSANSIINEVIKKLYV